jgi:hypothetical protein
MDHLSSITVVNGKLAKTDTGAIIMTIDPHRLLFRKIDREIRGSQNGRGKVYYAQIPVNGVENLGTFIARGDYEVRVESDKHNLALCLCPSCKNYVDSKQSLLCSPDTEKSNCVIEPTDCRCSKCPVHESSYLRKNFYCKIEKAKQMAGITPPDIIFVSDRYVSRLSDIISSGLSSADGAGYKNVAFSPIHHEVMWKKIEKNDAEKNREIALGLEQYFLEHSEPKIESIKIVVDDDPIVYAELIIEIEKHKMLKKKLKNKRSSIFTILKRSIFRI